MKSRRGTERRSWPRRRADKHRQRTRVGLRVAAGESTGGGWCHPRPRLLRQSRARVGPAGAGRVTEATGCPCMVSIRCLKSDFSSEMRAGNKRQNHSPASNGSRQGSGDGC